MERSPKPPLHNFSLPCLRWGNQRLLRCVKENSPLSPSPSCNNLLTYDVHQSKPTLPTQETSKDDITHIFPILPLNISPDPSLHENDHRVNGDSSSSRPPWNLRTRRAAFKTPSPLRILEEPRNGIINQDINVSSPRRHNCMDLKEKEGVKDGKVVKFAISLCKEEIEEDFMMMGRMRPPRRPKKRPRIVQKYLDSMFPGLWLSEIIPDSYKVVEVPES